jgi:hypothetical protein
MSPIAANTTQSVAAISRIAGQRDTNPGWPGIDLSRFADSVTLA